MKKTLSLLAFCAVLYACGNGEEGVVNDGFNGAGDANGALQDTANTPLYDGTTDTARQENRVDLQQRNLPDTLITDGQ